MIHVRTSSHTSALQCDWRMGSALASQDLYKLEMRYHNGMQGQGQDLGVPSLSVRTSSKGFSEEGEFYLMQVYAL